MKKNLFNLLFVVISFSLFSCGEDEKDPAYVGSWETELFSMTTTQATVQAKMDFDFKTTSFLTQVSASFPGAGLVQLLGVKGSVDEKENQTLGISLTDIGQWNSTLNDYDWKNRTSNSAEFDALYAGYLSTSLPKDFDAVYELNGSNLNLIVAAVNDTIKLYKK